MRKTILILFAVLAGHACNASAQTNYSSPNAPSPRPGRLTDKLSVVPFNPPTMFASPIRVTHSDNGLPVYQSGSGRFSHNKNETDVLAKRHEIRTELETLEDHHWAGFYYRGLPLGAVWQLALAPKTGFAYTCRSTDVIHVGGPAFIDQNYGEVVWQNDRLQFSPVIENDKNDDKPFPTEYILIGWETRFYLVPADGVIDFCNTVNSGRIVHGEFFVRGNEPKGNPTGMPDVPDKFKPYLLEQPIEGKIIAAEKPQEVRKRSSIQWEAPVTIDKGSRDGVLPGMMIYATNPGGIGWITLTDVAATESTGIMTTGKILEVQLVGWKVSTRMR